MIDHEKIWLRIRRVRNIPNPFELPAQRMENVFTAYRAGRMSEEECLLKLAEIESEIAAIRERLK